MTTAKQLLKAQERRAKHSKRILQNDKAVLPQVGMGCSHGAGGDSYPATIIEVCPTLDFVIIQDDEYVGGIKADPNADKVKYTLRKNGEYLPEESPLKHYWNALSIGIRRYRRDNDR